MDKPRVVADTNVLVSGLLWTGLPHKIIKLAENNYITLYSSLPIIEETSEVLERDKFISRIEKLNTTREELIESLLSAIEIIHPTESVLLIKSDPDDNKVLECALTAAADFIISGDPHLIELKSFRNTPIVTPLRFINLSSPK